MILFTEINKNKKTIIIYENQSQQIREAADDDFDTDNLEMTPAFNDEYNMKREFVRMKLYCKQHLGPVIGKGSSRIVYQIDDNRVLKLAGNRKGIAQNKAEAECYEKHKSELFPKIYNKAPDGMWIDCEHVLPAEEQDFEECTNFDFDSVIDIVNTLGSIKFLSGNMYNWIMAIVKSDPFVKELYDYIVVEGAPIGDILRICNWGMTMRNGVPRMVLLDSGFTVDVMRNYYQSGKYRSHNDEV